MSGDVGRIDIPPCPYYMGREWKSVQVGFAVAQTDAGQAFMEECYDNGIDVYVLPPGGVIPPEGIEAWRP